MSEAVGALAFLAVLAALVVLFAAGLRLRLPAAGPRRWLARIAVVASAGRAALLANVALFRNDAHLDLTREHAFTPSAEAAKVIGALSQDVELVYFYQKQSPAGRAAKTMVELMGRMSPRLHVRTVDPDQNPGLANRLGVRLYNAALLLSENRRIEVVTTDDRDIALGVLRVTRSAEKAVCFAKGHGEYDIDNFEFHTHFEGAQSHSHDAHGMAVVQMEQHGLGRLRRALDKLGLAAEQVTLALEREAPARCAALVIANPRTRIAPPEVAALARYLERGGGLLLLVEPDYPIDASLAGLLRRAGLRFGDGVVADPAEHYFSDEQMAAVTRYAPHAATRGLALAFFPGARPLELVPAQGVTATALFSTSAESFVVDRATGRAPAEERVAPRILAAASEGRLGDDRPPFRLVAVGDADFASNSFFPYMSNADLVLGLVAWLLREERAPAMKPPVEVLPTVTLTGDDVRTIFLVSVLLMPGLAMLAGGAVWWRRRR
jgi:hypothetical protein